MLAELIAGETLGVFLVFARLGAAVMLVPGLGEHYVLPRMRLLLALALSLLVAPAVAAAMPDLPREPLALAGLVAPEVLVGPAARLRRPAGAGGGPCRRLADRDAVGPVGGGHVRSERGEPGTVPGSFLAAAALTLLFAADFHHLLLRATAAAMSPSRWRHRRYGGGSGCWSASVPMRWHRRPDRRTDDPGGIDGQSRLGAIGAWCRRCRPCSWPCRCSCC